MTLSKLSQSGCAHTDRLELDFTVASPEGL